MVEAEPSIPSRPIAGAATLSAAGRRLAARLACALALGGGAGLACAADDEARRLEALAATHSMTIDRDPATAQRLRAHVERFPRIGGRPGAIGPVLSRRGAAGTLHVFEYTRSGIAMPGPQGRLLRAAPTMLGIVMEVEGARPLPAWQQDDAPPSRPPHTEASLARLGRIEDLRMATAGDVILFASRQDRFVLKQVTDQATSPEFHPGLFNSALPIDVQRALDVVAAMAFGQRPFERFATLPPIRTNLPATRPTGVSERLQEVRRDQDARLEALRAQQKAQREAAQAKPAPRLEWKRPDVQPATPATCETR